MGHRSFQPGQSPPAPSLPVRFALPSAPLQPWVDHYFQGTLDPGGPIEFQAVSSPSAGTQLVVTTVACMHDHHPDGGTVPKPRAFVFGPMACERAATLRLPPGEAVHLLCITFRPGAFAALFGESASQALNLICDPERLIRQRRLDAILSLCQEPWGLSSLSRLEALLLEWTAGLSRSVDLRAVHALTALQTAVAAGSFDVTRLARGVDLSTRQLERLFDHCFGLGPMHYARLWRFRRAASSLAGGCHAGVRDGWAGLGDLAYAHGFSDQAHMTREFKRFAGLTPRAYSLQRSHTLYLPEALSEPSSGTLPAWLRLAHRPTV